jgi:hypothetical protein
MRRELSPRARPRAHARRVARARAGRRPRGRRRRRAAPGPVDPTQPLPPGHVPVDNPHGGGDPHGGAENIHRARLPESYARESAELPPGVVVVRVIDAQGAPQPEVVVRVGAMREGEVAGSQEVRTGLDGTARIERMATTGTMAYRLSTDHRGARFGAPPFQLPPERGYEVQIVRHEVTDSPRGVLLWDARAEIRFKDDRAVFVMRFKVVNLSAMALGEGAPSPMTFVPPAGLRFPLPPSFTAFVTQPSMSDQRLTEEGGAALFRGSIPPTTNEPLEVVYQFQVKLEGGDVDLPPADAAPRGGLDGDHRGADGPHARGRRHARGRGAPVGGPARPPHGHGAPPQRPAPERAAHPPRGHPRGRRARAPRGEPRRRRDRARRARLRRVAPSAGGGEARAREMPSAGARPSAWRPPCEAGGGRRLALRVHTSAALASRRRVGGA